MKALKKFSCLVLISMISVSIWASLHSSVFDGGRYILANPWGVATLSDTYFAFYFIYLWIFYKEHSNFSRLIWFILVTLFGTIAIATYILLEIFKLKNPSMAELLLRKERGT